MAEQKKERRSSSTLPKTGSFRPGPEEPDHWMLSYYCLVSTNRSRRNTLAKFKTTLRSPAIFPQVSAVLSNGKSLSQMREELPDALDNHWLVLQRPQQSHSRDYLQRRSPINERSQKERHDQDHDDLVLV
jgi:hypothetical protein